MIARRLSAPTRLDADELDTSVLDERCEHAGRVAAAADAGDDRVRQLAELCQALLSRLAADDRLEIADHHRKWMWADDAADDVVSVLDGRHPVAHRLVDGVAQRSAATGHADDCAAQCLHLEDV